MDNGSKIIIRPGTSLTAQSFKETKYQDRVEREVTNVFEQPKQVIKPKKDHLAEMRRGVIYLGISLIMLSIFVFTVLRPFEQDMVNKSYTEYKKLYELTKQLNEERNDLVIKLRESYGFEGRR